MFKPARTLLVFISVLMLFSVNGCRSARKSFSTKTPTPTSSFTRRPTQTGTPTNTATFTPTQTSTLAFTITSPPTNTPTSTPTPYRVLSPTPTPSPIPLRPAALFPLQDDFGETIDWAYFHVTQLGHNYLGEVNDLWAFMAFQLLDRGIHHENFSFQGEIITAYFLNVAHDFNGNMLPVRLILGGTPGRDVPIGVIPAGGTAYIQVSIRDGSGVFSPDLTHQEANSAFETRDENYPLIFLKDLQTLLPELPDELILLANHPILVPRNDWPQIKLDMERVSYLTAR